jgi:predicted nucleic acid-binding protein
MMEKPLIFNSSPLIYITKVSLSNMLKEIPGEKITVTKVFNEIVEEGKKKGAPEASILENLLKKEIKVQNPNDEEYLKYVKKISAETERQPLHEAEAEVLCLAKQLKGIAIADDKATRSVAKLLQIEIHGTGYILGKIFATGKIQKEELIEKINEMRRIGWHISAEDYMKIIEYLKKL